MKRLFKVVSASLIALLAIVTLVSCDVKQQFKQEVLHEDSLMVSKMIVNNVNPTFNDIDDVIAYQRSESQWRKQDSAFFTIPEKVIPNVVAVLQKGKEPVTKVSITEEFENNKRIYLNLPNKPDVSEQMVMPDIPNTKVVDTVINGKKCRILESESNGSTITITRNMED